MRSFAWNELALLPGRAVWREATRTLFVADVHLGKAAAFREAGLPVPAGTTQENLSRLDALLQARRAARLVVLGDLFHARAAYRGASFARFAAWRRERAALAITLVSGNHDLSAGPPPATLGLETVAAPFAFEGLECRHHPLDDETGAGPPALAGHLHPATRLSGPARDSLRLPCFVLRGRQLILPAFGEFTGGALTYADPETALVVDAGERLLYLPAVAGPRVRARR